MMRKFLPLSLVVVTLFLCLNCMSQNPVIEIKSYGYTCNTNGTYRAIIALDDSAKLRIKNSFAKAFKSRWNIGLPEVPISAKPLPFPTGKPKFYTQSNYNEPGKWFLYLNVYERAETSYTPKEEVIPTTLELRCKMINGANDSVIIDNSLTVNIIQEPLPFDQVPLKRLAAFPPSFVKGFDSIATWLLSPKPITQRSLTLKPPCIFQETVFVAKPVNKILFHRDIFGIHQPLPPQFSFELLSPKYEKTGIKRNIGGRAFGNLFTGITGIGSVKTKSYKYKADYSYVDRDSTYHCLIGYLEDETAYMEKVKDDFGSKSLQTGDYSFYSRYTDPHSRNSIMLGVDTLASFSLESISNVSSLTFYDQMWDGRDSTTIIHLPPAWNNKVPEQSFGISGKMSGNSFTMKTLKGMRIKDFYINDQLAATFYGENEPVSAYLFRPVSARQLKIFTILSLLPYPFFIVNHL